MSNAEESSSPKRRTWLQRCVIGASGLITIGLLSAMIYGFWRAVLLPQEVFVDLFRQLVYAMLAAIGVVAGLAKIRRSYDEGALSAVLNRIREL